MKVGDKVRFTEDHRTFDNARAPHAPKGYITEVLALDTEERPDGEVLGALVAVPFGSPLLNGASAETVEQYVPVDVLEVVT